MSTTTTTNKITYGVSNVYYAIETIGTDGTVTYATPKPLAGATEVSLKTAGGQTSVAADNDPAYATMTSNGGYTGTISFTNISDDFKVNCLGYTIDTNNVVTENVSAKPAHFALLYQIEGDIKARRSVFYHVIADRTAISSKTVADKQDANTQELPIVIGKHQTTGDVKKTTSESTTDTVYNGWFTAVYTGVIG